MLNELSIRLGFFFGIFALMVIWEGLAPRRAEPNLRAARWPSNIGIVVLNTLIIRLVFPTTAVGLALVEGQQGWGLFNIVSLPYWATIITSVILLDLTL
ncbi:MAG: sterol desaturase family protein, partial [Nitrospirota bacterium]